MGAQKSKQKVTTTPKLTASSNIRQSRQPMAYKCLLLWTDTTIDHTNEDYENTLKKIQTITGNVTVFTGRDACIDFLTDAQEDITFFLIVKDTMSEQIMPLIDNIPQLGSVYIFDSIKILQEDWTKKWQKIKSVHTNIDDLCEGLQLDVKQHHQVSIAMSFITVNEMASTNNLNELEANFMYTQLFKEILLDMQHNEQAIKDFITYCRDHDCMSPKYIDRFEKEYHTQSAIWWYTFPSNIYSMLNCALRSMEGDAIINMGFFIHDLHQQIQQLHQQQVNNYHGKTFLVYRGQGLMKSDFEKLQKTIGGLMSFNNFLSTSSEQDIAVGLAYSASENLDMVGILFIMSVDPCIKSTPFASIKEMSYFKDEDKILFSMHTVFRVLTIKPMDNESQLYEVELQLTSDDDQQLRLIINRIREEIRGITGWQRLGNLLLKIGQFNKAEELYNVLLEQTFDESEKALYYYQLGLVHSNQGNYERAIWYYEKAFEIDQKTLPSNHLHLCNSYGNIGSMYNEMGEHEKALSFYEKALEIQQKSLPSNHPHLANLNKNIGSVYNNMGEYTKALSFFEKALEIDQKTLPSNHPDFAQSYHNIGMVYQSMGEYSKELLFYEKALEIRKRTLPSNHHLLATTYNNIGLLYDKMGKYSIALSSHEKALEIYQKSLPSNHPELATSYSNIGMVYNKLGECSKALSFLEKALEIDQNTLPSNHPHLAMSYNNIGSVYHIIGQYSKALSSLEKALEINQKSLPSNHPDFAQTYNNIGSVYYIVEEYSKALSFHKKALEIREKILSSNHPDVAESYNNIGALYCSMKDYSKALSYFERALDIRQRALSPTHPNIKNVKSNIETVKEEMKKEKLINK
ncbi:unnamed protein product [Adineta steineri]|uniref:NAD(P)(+)--arginine ADP-ribosyltransferase n=1 Tax=Adineta steineri TaxID=433720 RepID=A0A818K7V3_9BILA|nr:unnamed protein product [Adineta steineri]CAF3555284.1 unnamed protein product [Adineta steineri]